MSLICVSLTAKNVKGLARAARTGQIRGADVVELRLDHIEDFSARDAEKLRREIDFIPAIATLRPEREGGAYRGSEELRMGLLEKVIGCGFDYVDLELGIEQGQRTRLVGLCRKRGVKSIVSYHDFSKTPGVHRIVRKLEECAAAGDIGKVAYAAKSHYDTLRIISATKIARGKIPRFIAIGMGEAGRITRTLGPFLGSAIVYASLDRRRRTADGQPDVVDLRRAWGSPVTGDSVTPSTGLYGLIGCPLGHSMSPVMHNAAFKSLGIDAVYMPFEVEERFLKGTMLALKAIGLRGANVTIPYKERIIAYLDGLDDVARDVGAVNTIRSQNGELTGHNTDVRGFIDALKEAGVRLNGANAIVIGAGGAARAAAYGLLKTGAHVTVANRTRERALGLRRHLGAPQIRVAGLKALKTIMDDADILVNCTPAGMRGFAARSPVPAGGIHSGMTVLDMVYNPARTPLLARAEEKGARAISGMEMFVRQGMESFRIWTGRTVPAETIRRALSESQNHEN